ncbi:adenosylmethionine--8-amino-7-oxononanoate transaminase [Paracoccus sp. CPCC 101403]|uniref:Adenosylmethionine-8-amino-7-oxononanoate aminotransferase n=1 Tax=Paracoccus broussonetiae TaxID=3075834 RepID=A0ABU3ECI1_9RHOB|nr:adenosylmethionine--8-amino-7-oxononanoate transaminase [Paracoccus sp. CPCC 101403]MDT1061937.1 adenosylmethionine--8-amino-7-oxononanoate transaminase [Paracoccus sp. CPCC 101403]
MTSPIWHPFTQHALFPAMRPVVSAEGAWLLDGDGRQVFDAISSWWVVTHGHCHPRIVQAIRDQAGRLDQVIFAGHTHEPAREFADGLLKMVPAGLSRVFFSDSGSTSVEVALKMALGHFRHLGSPRHRVVVMQGSYHGDTVGTMSAGERGSFTQPYEPLLFGVDRIPFPEPGAEQATLDSLERFARDPTTAALLIEPLVLGAGGMRFYQPAILAEMAAICARHGVLLIADEVMTGWGRTGRFLACDHACVAPDILCLSKGITGGHLPLAVTLCREEIFQSHWSTDRSRTFFHSSSYTANPIACAAACANLQIWREEPVQARIDAVAAEQAEGAIRLEGYPGLTSVRCMGTILAAEIGAGGADYMADTGPALMRFFAERDLLIRPLGRTVYLLPPYCSTGAELRACHDAMIEAADVFG